MIPLPRALVLALGFYFGIPVVQISGTLQGQTAPTDSILAIAHTLFTEASILANQGHQDEAESKLQRVLDIREKALGLDHPDVALALHNLGFIYNAQGRYAEAEPLLRRALIIRGSPRPSAFGSSANPEQLGFHLRSPVPLRRGGTTIRASPGNQRIHLGPGPPGCSVRNE